jgi:hypothetical protein
MPVRALGLFSGGLDSQLAAALLEAQGVEVRRLHFVTGFGSRPRQEAVRRLGEEGGQAAPWLVDVVEDYFDTVVREPRHGYGAAMNPCLDCRIFMLRRAAQIAAGEGCGVLFTGEVLGQRSMDQSRSALFRGEREAGCEGRVLRPLCARLMPETEAERSGKVSRELLGTLHGSSRRGQSALAAKLGISGCPTPSGNCCRLAEPDFALRLRDLMSHREERRPDPLALELLGRGRHFRINWSLKAVVGRDEEESRWLAGRGSGRWTCQAADGHGALVLLEGEPDEEGSAAAASLAARYSRGRSGERVQVALWRKGERRELVVAPAPEAALRRWRIGPAPTTP